MFPKRTLGLWLFVLLTVPLVAWMWMGGRARQRQARLNQPLWAAVAKKDRVAAETAIVAGADVNARVNFPFFLSQYSHSLLSEAVRKGSPEVVELLLKHGADPHSTGYGGATVLESVRNWTEPKRSRMVKLLRRYGATH